MVRIVQITDCHLGTEKNFVSHGINTYESFSSVLHDIKEKCTPSLVIVSGDISSSGKKSSYQIFSDAMQSSLIDYRWLPGNHDNFALMSRVISQPFVRVEKKENWVIVSLISADPKSAAGRLMKDEIENLRSLLQEYQSYFILLFVHHHPVSINSKWLDEHCISNSFEIEKILAEHENVKAVFNGHVHQEKAANWNNIPVYSTPSTCYQFAGNIEYFQLENKAPGYRWIELYPNGHFDTGVCYLKPSYQESV